MQVIVNILLYVNLGMGVMSILEWGYGQLCRGDPKSFSQSQLYT